MYLCLGVCNWYFWVCIWYFLCVFGIKVCVFGISGVNLVFWCVFRFGGVLVFGYVCGMLGCIFGEVFCIL